MSKNNKYPKFNILNLSVKRHKYVVFVFVINEGAKVQKQLQKMKKYATKVDIVVADGGSTDGSLEKSFLKSVSVRTLLTKTGTGKLSAQMRMAFWWALQEGYKGVVVVDGNGKDDTSAIPNFIDQLDKGYDHIQGSRYIPGGKAVNTPKSRHYGLKLLHAPLISLASKKKHTDTTNGFRAYSARLLASNKVAVFRDVFQTYELHYHLAIEASRLGFKTKEIPVTRTYPKGKVPTKISPLKGNLHILRILFSAALGAYRFRSNRELKKKRFVSIASALAIIGFFASVAVFNPGMMSNDSISQLYQAKNLVFFDWHPIIMSMTWGVSMWFFGIAGFLIIMQALLWASLAVIACSLYEKTQRKISILALSIPFFPMVITISGMVWKDTMMAMVLLAATAIIVRYEKYTTRIFILLAALLVIAGLSRQNAIFAVAPFTYVLFNNRYRMNAALALTLLFCGFLFLANNYSHQFPRVKETNPKASLQLDDIIALESFQSNSEFTGTSELFSYLNKMENCSKKTKVVTNLYVRCSTPRDREIFPTKYKNEINSLWRKAVLSNLPGYISHRTAVFKTFLNPEDSKIYYWHPRPITPLNDDNTHFWRTDARAEDYKPEAQNPQFISWVGSYVKNTFSVASFLFKPLIYLISSALFGVVALRGARYKKVVLMLSTSSVLYIFGYYLTAVSYDFRYVFWSVLATLIMVILLAAPIRTKKGNK